MARSNHRLNRWKDSIQSHPPEAKHLPIREIYAETSSAAVTGITVWMRNCEVEVSRAGMPGLRDYASRFR